MNGLLPIRKISCLSLGISLRLGPFHHPLPTGGTEYGAVGEIGSALFTNHNIAFFLAGDFPLLFSSETKLLFLVYKKKPDLSIVLQRFFFRFLLFFFDRPFDWKGKTIWAERRGAGAAAERRKGLTAFEKSYNMKKILLKKEVGICTFSAMIGTTPVDLLRFTGKPGQNHCGSFETNEVGAESQSPFSER